MENQENNLVQSPAADGQKPVARKGQRRDAHNGENAKVAVVKTLVAIPVQKSSMKKE